MANVRSKSRKMESPSSVRASFFTCTPARGRLIGMLCYHQPPVICEQPQISDYQEGLKKQQLVFEFDVKTWEVGHHFSYV